MEKYSRYVLRLESYTGYVSRVEKDCRVSWCGELGVIENDKEYLFSLNVNFLSQLHPHPSWGVSRSTAWREVQVPHNFGT